MYQGSWFVFSYCILIDTIQPTNEEFTGAALTMLLKVLQECQCDLFNVMTISSMERKENKMTKLAGFLVYEVHETDAQIFVMNVIELIKSTNILHIDSSRENL